MTPRSRRIHLGHIGVKSIIPLGRVCEKYNLEWMEDVIHWWCTDLLKEITDANPTPTLTCEKIYELADFEELFSAHAVDKIRPDLSTSGGILRTHKIWLISMACPWLCTSPVHPWPTWPTSIVRRPHETSLHLKTIRSMFCGGRTLLMKSINPLSTEATSQFATPWVLASHSTMT
jgi:L-alanine-DL-glutamate epimerase-like enolase superfamily enzyme